MVHDERRLEQVLLAVLFEEQVNDVALCVPCLVLDVVLVSKLLCSFVAFYRIEINACILLDGVVHGKALERLTEIDLEVAVLDERRTADFICNISEHGLSELHHAVVISISLIQLHQRELGVVACIHTLVTENSADLKDSLEASDEKPLQIELERDPKLQIDVERIEVCLERSCRSTTGIGYQQRCLDFHEVTLSEEVTDLLDDLGSLLERILYLRVHDEVEISLAVTDLSILKALVLVREWMEALGKELVAFGKDRYLALLCHVHLTFDADDIADVEVLPCLVFLFGKVVDLGEDLDLAPAVIKVAERYLSHAALGHETACHSDGLACECFVIAGDLN